MMTTVRYLWWRSCYDGVLHAFPVGRNDRLAHRHYRASCTHAAPPDLAGVDESGPRCTLCSLIISSGAVVPAPRSLAQ
ncbi:hypothetical protein ACOBQX_25640 [Actinokineospora sp. G85]|uniref:hypothetical protein n=1 Tax=Actinokineospora sp. G85 TaxID=3406626 RepID=UPI003C7518B3